MADPRRLATATQVIIGAQAVLQVAVGVAGGTGSALFVWTLPVSVLLYFGGIMVFLCWFRRCRLNAEVFAPGTHRYPPGFAVGAWFIPLAMWWIPRRVALDVHRASGTGGGARVVDAWWAAWLAKTLGGAIVIRFQAHPDGFSPYHLVTGVAAAALAVLFVRQVTAGQDEKVHADLAALPFAPTPAA
ncbi:DUF4328 domain-containing protein [Kitasatospora sp. NPDC088391]|uniref:DUF4328 domain-containing protein n=1 Tax=Kitasatospora sp. NPDC088391 TaxID=3364074 RepID=UPI0037FAA968